MTVTDEFKAVNSQYQSSHIILPRLFNRHMSELHSDRPYKCKVDIALPSSIYAKHLRDVLSVDGELGNKIVKSFSVVSTKEYGDDDDNVGNGDDDVLRILRMYVLL